MVDKEEVKEVAENARLELTDDEVERFTDDFDEVLKMFQKIEEVDTEDTEPAFHPVDVEAETREDEVEESLSFEEVFANTDNEEDGKFKGPSA